MKSAIGFDEKRGDQVNVVSMRFVIDNTGAIALYKSFGLTRELHRYHYRRQPARD